MAVQTPPTPSTVADQPGFAPGVDAGVIEDARARQRRQRRVGLVLLAAAVAALSAGIWTGGGGGGGNDGGHPGGRPSGSGGGPLPALASASARFPGAPPTTGVSGVQSQVCPLAPPNRYLPPHSGCVSSRLADIDGDGRPDLIIAYSRMGQWVPSYPGEPAGLRRNHEARAAFLRVILADGTRVTRRIGVARAAGIDAVAHVSAEPGAEVFLEVQHISSGATVDAYGLHAGRLVPAGVALEYGGDSGVQAGFNCVSNPPRVIQTLLSFIGPNEFTRSWRETRVVYAWHGLRLVQTGRRTLRRLVRLRSAETRIGPGCLHGVG